MLKIKRGRLLAAPAFAVTLLFGAVASAPAQDKISLRVADSLPLTHVFSVGFQHWMKRVTEITNGQVEFQHFPNEQLAKRRDLFDMARNGTVDIAYVVPVDHPAQLARSTSVELPGFATLSACGTPVLQGLMKAYGEEEYLKNDVRPLFALYVGGYEVFSNKDVRLPGDVAGMKIRSGGGSQDVTLKTLRAVPVTLASPEVYEAVERRTIDGVLFPWTGVPPYKLDEVTRNATYGAALGATALTYVMNEAAYSKLPQNVKDAMTQATAEATPDMIAAQDKTLTELVEKVRSSGMSITDLTAEDRAAWRQALVEVEKAWSDAASRNGVADPAAVIAKRDELAAAANCG